MIEGLSANSVRLRHRQEEIWYALFQPGLPLGGGPAREDAPYPGMFRHQIMQAVELSDSRARLTHTRCSVHPTKQDIMGTLTPAFEVIADVSFCTKSALASAKSCAKGLGGGSKSRYQRSWWFVVIVDRQLKHRKVYSSL